MTAQQKPDRWSNIDSVTPALQEREGHGCHFLECLLCARNRVKHINSACACVFLSDLPHFAERGGQLGQLDSPVSIVSIKLCKTTALQENKECALSDGPIRIKSASGWFWKLGMERARLACTIVKEMTQRSKWGKDGSEKGGEKRSQWVPQEGQNKLWKIHSA